MPYSILLLEGQSFTNCCEAKMRCAFSLMRATGRRGWRREFIRGVIVVNKVVRA